MTTQNLLLAALALLGLLLIVWRLRRRDDVPLEEAGARDKRVEALDTVTGWPPEPTRVLTSAERRAHGLLTGALPDHIVLAQVPLARFIRVPTRNSYHEWMRRVGQLCADLVVCDTSAQVIAVVEVRRGYGKESERSGKRHERMDRVLNQAGVRVVVWNEDALPSPESVLDQVLSSPKGMHSTEGATAVSTRAAPPRATSESVAAPVAKPSLKPATTLEEVLEEIDRQPSRPGRLAEPPSSTWFDEFDSGRAPLDRLTPSDPLKR
jgi:hypothetical protein